MKHGRSNKLSRTECLIGWAVILGLILAHLLPYLREYYLPHSDYLRVMHVINYLHSPHLFGDDRLSQTLVNASVNTAPIYFYGFSYPLSFLLSAKWVMLSIGSGITLVTAYLAGGPWKTKKQMMISLLVIFIFIHLYLNPLEGNRRSFTVLFLVAIYWLDEQEDYFYWVFFTAIASGVYPPVALFMITYYGLRNLIDVYNTSLRLSTSLFKLLGLCTTFLLILTPYWMNLLTDSSHKMIYTLSLQYDLSSVSTFTETLLFGNNTAIFRNEIHLSIFLILVALVGLQKLILGKNFEVGLTSPLIVCTGLLLWILAHFLHHLIYQPFKYTRLSLIIGLLMPFLNNLLGTTRLIINSLEENKREKKFIYLTGIICLPLMITYLIFPAFFNFLEEYFFLNQELWKFWLGLPISIALLLFLDYWSFQLETSSFLALVLLFGLVFLPHNFKKDTWIYSWRGLEFTDLDGMFKVLSNSKPGSVTAGPPLFYMDPIPAFASRPIYASHNKSQFRGVCDRLYSFWKYYYSDSPFEIANFMKENNIKFLLVDRRIIRNKTPGLIGYCSNETQKGAKKNLSNPNPVLDQNFPSAEWSKDNRLYLLTRADILKN